MFESWKRTGASGPDTIPSWVHSINSNGQKLYIYYIYINIGNGSYIYVLQVWSWNASAKLKIVLLFFKLVLFFLKKYSLKMKCIEIKMDECLQNLKCNEMLWNLVNLWANVDKLHTLMVCLPLKPFRSS